MRTVIYCHGRNYPARLCRECPGHAKIMVQFYDAHMERHRTVEARTLEERAAMYGQEPYNCIKCGTLMFNPQGIKTCKACNAKRRVRVAQARKINRGEMTRSGRTVNVRSVGVAR